MKLTSTGKCTLFQFSECNKRYKILHMINISVRQLVPNCSEVLLDMVLEVDTEIKMNDCSRITVLFTDKRLTCG